MSLLDIIYNYLKKPSRYYTKYKYHEVIQNGDKRIKLENTLYPQIQKRYYDDLLVTTSYMYFLPFFYGLYTSEYVFAFQCMITGMSSTLYHVNGEQLYFNMDNIFATSLSLIYLLSLFMAFIIVSKVISDEQILLNSSSNFNFKLILDMLKDENDEISHMFYFTLYFLIGLLGIPLSAYLLVACGMPGKIIIDFKLHHCYRCQPKEYKFLHSIWHGVSSFGLMTTVWFLREIHSKTSNIFSITSSSSNTSLVEYITLYLIEPQNFLIVTFISLCISISINCYGNIKGIMPLD